MLIRRERPEDVNAIHAVTLAAFGRPVEADLIHALRACPAWIPALSLVALDGAGQVCGHVVCTRGRIGSADVLGLGPLAVRPDVQRDGVGSALVHTVLGAADALGEPLVALLGDPKYYSRFGFVLSTWHRVTPPVPEWAPHFQVRTLSAHDDSLYGEFRYPEPFDHV